jgi:hypothetical protein
MHHHTDKQYFFQRLFILFKCRRLHYFLTYVAVGGCLRPPMGVRLTCTSECVPLASKFYYMLNVIDKKKYV